MEAKIRVCKECQKRQPIENFESANIVNGKLYRRWKCRPCRRAQILVRLNGIKRWLVDLKSTLSCSECGENDFRVLDFHHDKGGKDIEIANALRQGWRKERIMKEIKKCSVLCSNCHRILHWELRNKQGVGQSG